MSVITLFRVPLMVLGRCTFKFAVLSRGCCSDMPKRGAGIGGGPPVAKRCTRLGGGSRQVIARAFASAGQASKLATLLLDLWCWGELSTPMVQRIAAAGKSDGIECVDLVKLADLGTEGMYPGNMHRELVNQLRPSSIQQHCSTLRVYYKSTKRVLGGVVEANVPVVLPHELFAIMYSNYREAFDKHILGGDPQNICRFWCDMEGSAYFEQHPMKKRLNLKERAVPLALHGDGVSIVGVNKTWTKSVDAYSWSSLLGSGPLTSTNFLVFIEYLKLMLETVAMNTHDNFSKLLAWSFYWLSIGKWPTRDVHGNEYPPDSMEAIRARDNPMLAGGYYGLLYLVRADLEHMTKAFGFQSTGESDKCSCCGANTSDLPWTDCRELAAWLATVWTDADWRAAYPNRHPIFKLPGMGISAFIPDIMHCVYLGAYQYCFGSIIQYLSHHKLHGSPDQNCLQLWQDLRDVYKEMKTPSQLDDLKVTKYFRQNQFPLLKGRAAEMRHLPRPLLAVFSKHMDPTSDTDKKIVLILQMCCQMEDIISDHKHMYKWPAEISEIYAKAIRVFVQCNQSLGHFFHARGLFLFHMTIKYHYMMHIAERARDINPILGWCFAGETMMKRVKDIARNSHRGSAPIRASIKVMEKYCFGLGFQLHGRVWR